MDEFELDRELHETLAGIRGSMRQLFEQLRLKNESGDISGKDRLERVPALAKRNFRNLAGPAPLLAIKEAWRLVDFLEGTDEARLSPRARDALRVVELDKKLARLRASDRWKDAAAGLREALGAAHEDKQSAAGRSRDADLDQEYPTSSAPEAPDEPRDDDLAGLEKAAPEPASLSNKLRRPVVGLLIGSAVPTVLILLTARWLLAIPDSPRTACLALERTSVSALAAHWAIDPGTPIPLPAPSEVRPNRVVYTISDPDAGPVRSIWTTSQFSHAEETGRRGPGGGKADVRLRVGGWGDTYLSLLQFPIPDNRLVRRASIRLVVLGDHGSRPTTMTLRVVNEPWRVLPGPQHRLWWRDCPQSDVVRRHLPAPGARDSTYEIDITDIYNQWASGVHVNHGILLEPEHIGAYGRSGSHYANFSTFYSTRALDPANRPTLILTY